MGIARVARIEFGIFALLIGACIAVGPERARAETTLQIGIGTQNTTTNTVASS